METGIIYIITNKISGKKYIGKTTTSFDIRWKHHLCAIRKNNPKQYIHRSIKKHGLINFETTIMYFPVGMLDEKEKEYIKILNTKFPNGYNLTDGGEGVMGLKYTKKQRERNRLTHLGKEGYWKNKSRSDETKEKISKSLTGKKQSLETIKKRAAKQIGRLHTEKAKLKMSLNKKQEMRAGTIFIPISTGPKKRYIYHFENENGIECITDDFNGFCEKYNITQRSAWRIINEGTIHKNWHGFKIKKRKIA